MNNAMQWDRRHVGTGQLVTHWQALRLSSLQSAALGQSKGFVKSFSVGQTAQRLTCSVREKQHTGLDACLRILLSCFRKMMSEHSDVLLHILILNPPYHNLGLLWRCLTSTIASSIFLYLESMMSLMNLMLSAQYVILSLNLEHRTTIYSPRGTDTITHRFAHPAATTTPLTTGTVHVGARFRKNVRLWLVSIFAENEIIKRRIDSLDNQLVFMYMNFEPHSWYTVPSFVQPKRLIIKEDYKKSDVIPVSFSGNRQLNFPNLSRTEQKGRRMNSERTGEGNESDMHSAHPRAARKTQCRED